MSGNTIFSIFTIVLIAVVMAVLVVQMIKMRGFSFFKVEDGFSGIKKHKFNSNFRRVK